MKTRLPMLGLLAGLFAAAPVFAQDGASGTLEQSSNTSDKEKIAFATDAVAELNSALADTQKLLADAEKKGDPYEIQCVRKKMQSIAALAAVTEDLSIKMQSAIASGQDKAAEEYFRNIAVSVDKAREFKAQAQACSSSEGTTPGEVNVDVSDDGLSTSDDTSLIEDGMSELGVDPPGSSPFE